MFFNNDNKNFTKFKIFRHLDIYPFPILKIKRLLKVNNDHIFKNLMLIIKDLFFKSKYYLFFKNNKKEPIVLQ